MITAIIQARMGSSRLPGKVLKELAGQPMIAHVIQRVQAARRIEQIILATTTHPSDDPLAEFAASLGIAVYRGSVDDVLDRYYQAARCHNATVIVRITGDCPVIDPAVIDATVGLFLSGDYAYANNFMQRTYPDGLDTEVFTFEALSTAWEAAKLPSEREHVTPYLYKHPERFKQVGLLHPVDRSAWRWTVDEAADFDFISAVYAALYPQNPLFGMEDIAHLLESHPELADINAGFATNEGYQKSLQADEAAKRLRVASFQLHEMMIPFQSLRGYAGLLYDPRVHLEMEQVKEFAEILLRGEAHARQNLRDLWFVLAPPPALPLEGCALSDIVTESISHYQAMPGHMDAQLENQVGEGYLVGAYRPYMPDDLASLIQTLLYAFCEQLRVAFTARQEGEYTRLQVALSGICTDGIAPDTAYQAHVESFFQDQLDTWGMLEHFLVSFCRAKLSLGLQGVQLHLATYTPESIILEMDFPPYNEG